MKTIFIPGTGIVFLNALFATITTLIVKVHVRKMSPEILNLNRAIWLLVFSTVMFFIYKIPLGASKTYMLNLFTGALLEFIAILCIYYSFHFIEAARSSIIQSLKGIVVLIVAYFFFGTFPLPHQVLGGLVTVLGILIMTLAQAGVFSRRKNERKAA
jgi:drug/metabolite transporter (DMT)-like permease